MKITIHNYEEYALDYLDGNLDKQQLQEFEQFLDEHPTVREEIGEMGAVDLPEQEIPVLPDKDDLLRASAIVRAFRKPLYVPVWSVAACLALLIGFFVWWQVTGPDIEGSRSMTLSPVIEAPGQNSALNQLKEKMNGKNEGVPLRKNVSPERPFTVSTEEHTSSESPAATTESTSSEEVHEGFGTIASDQHREEHSPSLPEQKTSIEYEKLKNRTVAGIDRSRPELTELQDRPMQLITGEGQPLSAEALSEGVIEDFEEEGGSLSDHLVDLTPSSWPDRIRMERLKDAFIPNAFNH